MACYHPMIGIPNSDGTYRIISSADNDHWQYVKKSDPRSILVPCGRCLGCKFDYSRTWADRMMLELETMKKGVFLTLTYDDEHLPQVPDEEEMCFYPTLRKSDWQLFMKRLRKHYEPVKLRFYAAGEYGPTTGRPHMHAIVFGIGLCDIPDLVRHGKNEIGQQYFISDMFAKIWSCGFVLVSDVSWKTCAYVARYVTKKMCGPDRVDLESLGVQKEFALMSRKPGIGRQYLDDHPDCLDLQYIDISTPQGGKRLCIPKYFLNQLDNKNSVLYNPERFDMIKKERMQYAVDKNLLELRNSEKKGLDYLAVKEQKLKDSVKVLSRSKI